MEWESGGRERRPLRNAFSVQIYVGPSSRGCANPGLCCGIPLGFGITYGHFPGVVATPGYVAESRWDSESRVAIFPGSFQSRAMLRNPFGIRICVRPFSREERSRAGVRNPVGTRCKTTPRKSANFKMGTPHARKDPRGPATHRFPGAESPHRAQRGVRW